MQLDTLTAATPSEIVDVLVTWTGGVTLARYRLAIGRSRDAGLLERRAGVLISVSAVLLFIRGASWLEPQVAWLGVVMLVTAALLPLAMALFAEGLLRRHASLWVKVLAASATAVSLITAITAALFGAHDNPVVSFVLLGSIVIVMAALFVELAMRDKSSLSRAENSLVRVMLVVALISVPLIATDFRFALGWPPARLGTLAALLFCYTLLRRPDERGYMRRWLTALLRLVIRATLVCSLLLIALQTAPRSLMFPMLVLATAFVFALAVNDRLGAASTQSANRALLRWLARAPADSLTSYLRELRHLPLTADALLMTGDELASYHPAAILAAFEGGAVVRARGDLRRDTAGTDERSLGADELADLLDRTGMTHVGLLSEHPLRLLLGNISELPGATDAELALSAVVRQGRAAAARERTPELA